MPELPDVTVYQRALASRLVGAPLEGIRFANPFLLRTVEPSPKDAIGRRVVGVERIGKRIVLGFEEELFFVIHLMIAGRLRFESRGSRIPGKIGLAAFDFPVGTLLLTEASPKKRASLHVVRGRQALAPFDRGGLEPTTVSLEAFAARLASESHTLKRALTDPRLFDGIGNAYSDEILHAARLSPVARTRSLDESEVARLHEAARTTLVAWTERLVRELGDRFPGPGEVTAFREGFAVHGRYGEPCPVCGTEVQRIRYADNETNYCPRCQTEGRVLADRSLSRLLKDDWPRSIEDLEGR